MASKNKTINIDHNSQENTVSNNTSKEFAKIVKSVANKIGGLESMRLASERRPLETLSTGSLLLDQLTGGGIPRGRITELYGLEGSGKTTLALSIARVCQQNDPKNFIIYIDVECAITESLLKMNNIDQDRFLIIQPESGEIVFEYIESFAETAIQSSENNGQYNIPLVIVDSIAALVPSAELVASMQDMQIGAQARLVSKGLRKVKNILARSNIAAVFINQVRSKVGIIYGNPETTPGGKAMAFYSTLRMRIKSMSNLKSNANSTSVHIMEVVVKKNKCAPIEEPVILEMKKTIGFDIIGEIIDLAIKKRILQQRGSWIFYKEQSLGQGKQKCREFFVDPQNRQLLQNISNEALGYPFEFKDFMFD